MTQAPHVAFIGEAMIEITPGARHDAQLNVAGDVLNTAVYFRRLCAARDVRFVTALGGDPFSNQIHDFLSKSGLDTSCVRTLPDAQCGLYSVSNDASGERSFSYWRSTSAARSLFSEDADFAALEGSDIVYLTGITLAIISPDARARLLDWIEGARKAGARVAFDSNYRPALWDDRATAAHWIARIWQQTDIGFPSVDDEMALFRDADVDAVRARFESYGIAQGALKRGADGADAIGAGWTCVSAHRPAQIVDTTAAGDSFNAGYLAALIKGHDQIAAIDAGHAVASQVVARQGAIVEVQDPT